MIIHPGRLLGVYLIVAQLVWSLDFDVPTRSRAAHMEMVGNKFVGSAEA